MIGNHKNITLISISFLSTLICVYFIEGLPESQRKKKGKEKLENCISTVQEHLEQSYRVELPVYIDELQM